MATATQSKSKTAAKQPTAAADGPKPEKLQPVKAEEIAWGPDESGTEGVTAIVRGFALAVTPIEDKPGRFLWSLQATSEVSETPELIAADECASEKGGRRWARQTLNRTLKTWQGKGAGA
jgi:hypothetical protein